MENYFKNIEKKLEKKISYEKLEIVDNSLKHKGHKFFSEDKYHLHLKIQSVYLRSISRLSAQKMIMNILKEDLKHKIHALEISIE
ncbi:MAG: BolA/IbaG family iron-sulfur metabolism protein [Candidatus Pelagibacter sp. TMED153]|nr:MAG: BolA/IbaG family iron-sulfur metabolism protein [Candidatus Pelagibacter sp. TMED153]|tara:strand:- start:3564 stop:3818 length:255 start_codon:yes stop_codon:yes gene_type:complete